MTFKYLSPLDHGSLGTWDSWTLGLLNLFPPPPPHTFSYLLTPYLFLLFLPTTSYTLLPPLISSYFLFVWYGLIWFGIVLVWMVWYGLVWGGGCQMTIEFICEEIPTSFTNWWLTYLLTYGRTLVLVKSLSQLKRPYGGKFSQPHFTPP